MTVHNYTHSPIDIRINVGRNTSVIVDEVNVFYIFVSVNMCLSVNFSVSLTVRTRMKMYVE